MTLIELISDPTFFDKFGLVIFTFITIIATYMLYARKLPDRKVLWLLLVVGILGLITDGTILIILGRIA